MRTLAWRNLVHDKVRLAVTVTGIVVPEDRQQARVGKGMAAEGIGGHVDVGPAVTRHPHPG